MEQEALQLHEQLTRYCETPTSAAAAVVELVRTSKDPANAVEILVDLIWLFDLQFTELGDEGARARERLHQLVQQLLLSNLAPEDLLKSRLELEFLEQVGLIDSAALWSKRAVRMNTTMFYKQKKFNLLREESEGYAKIITELEMNIRRNPTEEKLRSVQQIITSIIGYFSLDANRVLDIMLDVFSQNSTCVEFFIPLIRQSQWGLGDCEYLRHKLADLMGFKLSHHPNHRGHRTLYTVAALLIKHSMLSLDGLYPHLSPPDEQIALDYERYIQQCRSGDSKKPASGGGLPDTAAESTGRGSAQEDHPHKSSAPSSPAKSGTAKEAVPSAETTEPVEKINQKARLCHALLQIGDLTSALILLQRQPKLAAFDSEVVPNLTRCIHSMIEPLYCQIRPKSGQQRDHTIALGQKRINYIESAATTRSSDTQRLLQLQEQCLNQAEKADFSALNFDLQLPSLQKKPFSLASYPEFATQLPQCSTIEDFTLNILPLLHYIGCELYKDPSMLTKLCRIIRWDLERRPSSSEQSAADHKSWLFILSTYILPSISMMPSNPAIVDEVWSIIKGMSYQTRYTLYGEWKNQSYDRYPELVGVRQTVVMETKKILRRISKDNYKKFSRVLARWGHSNPAICFSTMLDQVQSYENLIGPVVDCYRCCTPLGFDVLVFLLIEALANPNKQRLKPDGTNLALWLNSLALFAGTLFKSHPEVDLTGLLFYIWYQGKAGNNFDLVVLKELVTQMTGIEQLTEGVSDHQLEALAGGETLRSHILAPGGLQNIKQSSAGLVNALLNTDLAIPMAILIGKQRNSCIFHTEIPHLKLLSSLLDQVHETLLQYVGFLRANLDKTDFIEISPSLTNLCLKNQLDPEVSWFIIRAKLDCLLDNVNSDASGSKNDGMDIDSEIGFASTEQALASIEEPTKLSECVNLASSAEVWLRPLHPFIVDSIRIIPAAAWQHITPHFYVTFWQLNLYDIYVPKERYESEIANLKQTIHSIDHDPLIGTYQDSSARILKRKTDKEECQRKIQNLSKELMQHIEHNRLTLERLEREKNHWFPGGGSNRLEIVSYILQHCLHPRSLFSGTDSLYTAKFLLLLQSLGTPNFSTLSMMERIISDVSCTVSLCTLSESMHFGRYLKEILAKLHDWHKYPGKYNKEAIGESRGGFRKRWQLPQPVCVETQPAQVKKSASEMANEKEPGEINDSNETKKDDAKMQVDSEDAPSMPQVIHRKNSDPAKLTKKDFLQHSDYRSVLHKWHVRLHKAFISCLESKDYIKMRNAVVVLDKIADFFPIIKQIGSHIEGKMAGIMKAETREDLKLLLTRYDASLKRNSSRWVPIEKFHSVDKPSEQPKAAAANGGKAAVSNDPSKASKAEASKGAVDSSSVQAVTNGPNSNNNSSNPPNAKGTIDEKKPDISTPDNQTPADPNKSAESKGDKVTPASSIGAEIIADDHSSESTDSDETHPKSGGNQRQRRRRDQKKLLAAQIKLSGTGVDDSADDGEIKDSPQNETGSTKKSPATPAEPIESLSASAQISETSAAVSNQPARATPLQQQQKSSDIGGDKTTQPPIDRLKGNNTKDITAGEQPIQPVQDNSSIVVSSAVELKKEEPKQQFPPTVESPKRPRQPYGSDNKDGKEASADEMKRDKSKELADRLRRLESGEPLNSAAVEKSPSAAPTEVSPKAPLPPLVVRSTPSPPIRQPRSSQQQPISPRYRPQDAPPPGSRGFSSNRPFYGGENRGSPGRPMESKLPRKRRMDEPDRGRLSYGSPSGSRNLLLLPPPPPPLPPPPPSSTSSYMQPDEQMKRRKADLSSFPGFLDSADSLRRSRERETQPRSSQPGGGRGSFGNNLPPGGFDGRRPMPPPGRRNDYYDNRDNRRGPPPPDRRGPPPGRR